MPQSTTLHDLSTQQSEEVAALRKEIEDTDGQIRDLDRKLKPLKATKKRLAAKLRDRQKQATALAQLHGKRHKQPFLARGLGFGGCFFHP
jgi:septal ring factor EnvC (AmiA/AmiB activator)